MLGLAVLAVGLQWLSDRLQSIRVDRATGARWPIAICGALIAIESFAVPIPVNGNSTDYSRPGLAPLPDAATRSAPPVYDFIASLPSDSVLVELPLGEPAFDVRYMFYSTRTGGRSSTATPAARRRRTNSSTWRFRISSRVRIARGTSSTQPTHARDRARCVLRRATGQPREAVAAVATARRDRGVRSGSRLPVAGSLVPERPRRHEGTARFQVYTGQSDKPHRPTTATDTDHASDPSPSSRRARLAQAAGPLPPPARPRRRAEAARRRSTTARSSTSRRTTTSA